MGYAQKMEEVRHAKRVIIEEQGDQNRHRATQEEMQRDGRKGRKNRGNKLGNNYIIGLIPMEKNSEKD